MSNLAEEVRAYLKLPKTPRGLLSDFARGRNEEQLVRELMRETGKKRPTAQRQLQRWGITGKKQDKQVRNPENMRRETRRALRRIIRQRHFPARIRCQGIVKSTSNPKDPGRWRVIVVGDWKLGDLRDLKNLAIVAGRNWLTWGRTGEETVCGVFNGWYFPVDPEPLIPGDVVAIQPFDETLDFSGAAFDIYPEREEIVQPKRRGRKIKKAG